MTEMRERKIGTYIIRTPPRKYDYAKIGADFQKGRTNREIADDVGCKPAYIATLRWRFERGKLRC